MALCPNCGEDNSERARFCQACATPLTAEPPTPARVRKTVTIVFTDVAGSTAIGERLDPESVRSVMARYFDVAQAALKRHGGTVEKFIGDAVVAVFGIPVLHEDDALRAVRAAAEMRRAMAELNQELEPEWGVTVAIRTGVNTGEVVSGDAATGGTLATGDAMNVAARFEQAAGSGEILIGERTYRLVRDAVEVEAVEPLTLKGKSEPIPAYRLIKVLRRASSHAQRLSAPMIGRTRELGAVMNAFQAAVDGPSCRLVTVLGAAGVGKSRLVEEALERFALSAKVLTGRCLSYGEGITYWPIAEVVREAVAIDATDSAAEALLKISSAVEGDEHGTLVAARVAAAVGLAEGESSAAETFWAIRRFLEADARRGPIVVVIDDVHWAQPTLLDLIEHIVTASQGVAFLILCVARPELLEIRTSWSSDRPGARVVRLEPLIEGDAEILIDQLLGRTTLGEDIRSQVTSASGGNPLFVEEMLSMLIDEGRLQRHDGTWIQIGDLSEISVPPTISALLSARLDRLPPDERRVLEPAAVAGQVFYMGAVSELAPEVAGAKGDEALASLTRKDFIVPEGTAFASEVAFRFRHILIRDAAYAAMPKQIRADLHEGFAAWLGRVTENRLSEYEEILGYHLEQAYRIRCELRPPHDRDRELAGRAAELLASAGRRALARSDMRAVVSLFSHAVGLLPEHHPMALELSLELGIAHWEVGEVAEAEHALRTAAEKARSVGDDPLEARVQIAALRVRAQTDPDFSLRSGVEQLEGLATRLESAGDDRGLARAWLLLGTFHYWAGHVAMSDSFLERAIELARAAGDTRQQAVALSYLTLSLFDGPADVATSLGRIREILVAAGGHGEIEARALCARGGLEAMQGRFEDARESIEQSRRLFDDLGLVSGMLGMLPAINALVEVLAGDPDAAESELRRACNRLEAMGETGHLSTMAGELARVLSLQRKDTEALRFSEVSKRNASPDDVLSQVLWRGARARVLGRRREHEPAELLARSAVEIADRTDYLNMRGNALMDLGEVLRLGGRPEDASNAIRAAQRLYEQIGNVVSEAVARAALRDAS